MNEAVHITPLDLEQRLASRSGLRVRSDLFRVGSRDKIVASARDASLTVVAMRAKVYDLSMRKH